jgi:hypothetical protein
MNSLLYKMKYYCKKSQYYNLHVSFEERSLWNFRLLYRFQSFNMFHVCNIPKLDSKQKHNKALVITKT